jgi:hypothetical protein
LVVFPYTIKRRSLLLAQFLCAPSLFKRGGNQFKKKRRKGNIYKKCVIPTITANRRQLKKIMYEKQNKTNKGNKYIREWITRMFKREGNLFKK